MFVHVFVVRIGTTIQGTHLASGRAPTREPVPVRAASGPGGADLQGARALRSRIFNLVQAAAKHKFYFF